MRRVLTPFGALTLAVVGGWSADALELELPLTARISAEVVTALGQFDAPTGVYAASGVPNVALEGRVDRTAWRISTAGLTPLQVIAPLRAQLEDQGFDILFDCAARECGGFDFRFAIEVLPGPNMYVNLSQYHYTTAILGPHDAPREAVGLLVSVADASAYVQVIHVDTAANAGFAATTALAPEPAAPVSPSLVGLEAALKEKGRVILSDLVFASGTSNLSEGPYPSLTELARLLIADQGMRLVLVWHTDNVGELEPNVALSRARAVSVQRRLIEAYSVSPEQLDAQGMGYLAPVASNLTPEGRDENRRVEAVLVSGE